MAALKRNIWALYLLIVLLGAAILTAVLYQRWHSIVSDEAMYQVSRAKLVHQSVNSFLHTQELVLDVIGRELLDSPGILEGQRAIPLLDSILSVNPTLVGFGLANADGKLVRVSSNLDLSKLPNLRTNPATAKGFALALESDHMVVGRTYHVDALAEWVIPVRKALRAPDGRVVAVMTAGLRVGEAGMIFSQQLHDSLDDSVILFRERDRYVQFMSRDNIGPEQYSEMQFSETEIADQRRVFEDSVGLSKPKIMESREAFTFFSRRDGLKYLAAVIYDPHYELWTISESSFAPLHRKFSATLLFYVSGSLLIIGILYLLFRVIDRAERAKRQELLFQARHDDLTGLLNRAGLLDRLKCRLGRGKPFSLVVINIDNFSGINDRFGLEHGDDMLVEFGGRLKRLVYESDDLARLGGDEFVIATPNTDLPLLTAACDGLVQNLVETFEVGRLHLQVGVRIGVARFPDDGDAVSELIRSAHLALHEARQSRSTVCVYRSDMETAYLRGLSVEQRLRFGLAARNLHMVYQPQVDERGTMTGLEALVRWQDDELGFVSPAEFIPVAERSGLMIPLGKFVLDTSLEEFSPLLADSPRALDLAINISVVQFCQADFVETVLSALAAHQVAPERLVLEITESLFMDNFQQVLETVCRLRDRGIRIAMDDFGTGYSSLSLLRQLPLDELKIDKSFVDAVVDDEKAANMVRSIVAIADSHKMSLIAEGVEDKAQASALIKLGCFRFQGYHFGRPVALAEIRDGIVLASQD